MADCYGTERSADAAIEVADQIYAFLCVFKFALLAARFEVEKNGGATEKAVARSFKIVFQALVSKVIRYIHQVVCGRKKHPKKESGANAVDGPVTCDSLGQHSHLVHLSGRRIV